MNWLKHGIVWGPDQTKSWARSHAMAPTPIQISADTIRVYLTTLDDEGRGHATFVDVSASNPHEILRVSDTASLSPGAAGSFDDNGVMPLSIVVRDGVYLMYYAGYEICTRVRYRIFTGLAISQNGENFRRYSSVPVLDRTDGESFFRGGPFAMLEDSRVRLWYVGGDKWTSIDGKSMPVYDLRHLSSCDGLHWASKGQPVMDITEEDEHGFGRPWIVKRGAHDYQLFYSIRRKSVKAYRLGYAESADGLNWIRKDEEMGLDVSPDGFDSDAIMYSAVINVAGKTYCFYNGNEFGKEGFAFAELVV